MRKLFHGDYSNEGTLSNGRVIHEEGQVRSLSDLVTGKFYYSVRAREGSRTRIQFLRVVNDQWIECKDNSGQTIKISLRDRGVIPYDSGQWNALNYLVSAEKSAGSVQAS